MGDERNLKLTIEYEGSAYHGWQNQKGLPSVQGELERAVGRVVDHPVVLHGSGRTDRGVHALGQVANFRTTSRVPPEKLLLGANGYLPRDIRVRRVEEVAADFHARYSALGKRYRYTVLRAFPPGEARSSGLSPGLALLRRLCAIVAYPLDVEAMRLAAEAIRGVRDFRAFEGNVKRRPPAAGAGPRSTVRTVEAVVVREAGPYVLIDAFGRGFLYHMVRTIAGTLLLIGQGKRRPDEVEEVLRSGDRRRAGFTAPAEGLCLSRVYYLPDELASEARSALGGGRVDAWDAGPAPFLNP